jgi:hypothetical protein
MTGEYSDVGSIRVVYAAIEICAEWMRPRSEIVGGGGGK